MMNSAPSPSTRKPGSPLWPFMAILFCAPFMVMTLARTRMVNDVETWLPSNDPGAKILSWTQAHFEPENRFLVSWDSSSLADPRVAALAARLDPAQVPPREAGDPLEDIQSVVTPQHVLSSMLSQGVELDTAIRNLGGVLIGPGPLKVRLTEAGLAQRETVERQLVEFAANELDLEVSITAPLTVAAAASAPANAPTVPDDASDEPPDAAREFSPSDWSPPPHHFRMAGTGLSYGSPAAEKMITFARGLTAGEALLVEDCFFSFGAPVALSVSVHELGDDRLRDAIQAVRRAAAEVGISPDELRMGGSPIGRIELNQASFKALWNVDYPLWMFHKRSPIALSAIVGTLLAFYLLKSVRLALLVLFTATYTAAATVALVPASGQSLNTVLMVMPNLMLVVTMSSLIHMANYWRHAAFAGDPDAVTTAARTSREPTLLANVTTSIGLASLLTSVLLPVRQFGLFSAAGCVLAMVMILWVFPGLMRLWPGRPAALAPPHENAWHKFGLWLTRHHRAVFWVFIGLYVYSAWSLTYFRTETKVIRYFPEQARIVQDYQFLEDHLAGIISVDVILRFPPEKRPAEVPVPAAAAAVTRLDLFQRMELVRALQKKLLGIEGISGAISLADFRKPNQPRPERVDARYLRSLQVAKKRIFEQREEETREFVTHAQTPLSVVVDEIPLRVESGDEVWRIRAQCSALTNRHYGDLIAEIDSALTSELRSLPGVEHFVTGMVPLFLRTQEALLESLINSFGLAFATIGAVMMYQMRSITAGALAMLPNILPIAIVFGTVSVYGIPLDVGTMITASIAMGISVDSELHFVTWFRDCLHRGMSRDEAVSHGLAHCGPAMWQSCLVIALALQMLMFTDLLMISRFGWLMAAMTLVAMVADLVYMPALLAGLMGRVIERQVARQPSGSRSPVDAALPPEVMTTP